jgi:hypothetical protein
MTDEVTNHIKKGIEELKTASELSNCGYCKKFLGDAIQIVEKYEEIKDNIATVDNINKKTNEILDEGRNKLNNFSKNIGIDRNNGIIGNLMYKIKNRPRLISGDWNE